ncbi:MAG: hypothetical protein HOG70_04865 [Elusimicrobiaceae bacterium]|nr:hypothetical protein [Elusimicrobiaceae bacterium]
MSNIIKKFKEFPLSIKIISIFYMVAIFKLIQDLGHMFYVLPQISVGESFGLLISIFGFLIFCISFIIQLIYFGKKNKKAYVISIIHSVLAFFIGIPRILIIIAFIGCSVNPVKFSEAYFCLSGFTFFLPGYFLYKMFAGLSSYFPLCLNFFSMLIIIVGLEIWKVNRIKKYCVK